MWFRRIPELTPTELAKELQSETPPLLLDVREPDETAVSIIDGAVQIPMGEVGRRFTELDKAQSWVVYCASGARSSAIVQFLQGQGFENVRNLKGGIYSWVRTVEPSLPVG